ELDKLVSREKENRRAEIVRAAVSSVAAHIADINATLGEHAISIPSTLQGTIGAAIKGKRTLSSIKDAADSAAAQAKIDASQRAERTRACIAVLAEFPDHAALFADRVQLCATKTPEDLRNLAKARVTEHEQREAARLEAERERIRQEEAERIERERAAADAAQSNTAERAIETEQPSPAAGGGRGDSTGALRAAGEPGRVIAKPPTSSIRLKLGDLNAAIAPLSITADGLAGLGFKPVASRGAAKLYDGADFEAICLQLRRVIAEAPERLALQAE